MRVAMTLLANALMLGGHFEEAQSLVAQSEALHERLTGGVNDEGIAQASRHSLVCALRGDGQGALLHLARLDALAAASGEAESLAIDRFPLRVLTLATAGRPAEALEHADAMDPHFATLTDTARVRTHRARALALRLTGSPESGRDAVEAALSIAAEGGCIGLEHGLALAEAARCSQATRRHCRRRASIACRPRHLGSRAGRRRRSAAARPRRARAAASGALTPFAAAAASAETEAAEKFGGRWHVPGANRVSVDRRGARARLRGPAAPFTRRFAMEHDDHERPLLAALVLFAALCVYACGGGDDSATTPSVDADGCTTAPAIAPVDTPSLSRQGELPRSNPRGPGWQWPCVFRLPHGLPRTSS